MRRHRLALAAAPVLAALTFAQPARANVMIVIDKAAQKMTVTVDGEDRYAWPVSTGRQGYDTPSGEFQPFRMERDHFSREWDDAPMPNSIFFTKIGHAIHGTFEARNLGRPASHGCVRLSTENAATLFALVKQEGVFNTRVKLTGETPSFEEQPVARRDRNTTRKRDFVRDYTTDDDDKPDPQPLTASRPPRGVPYNQDSSRSFYNNTRERPYYENRSFGRGIFSSGW
ncbi:MAG: L,D-transpeptidase [Pseudolabrys sp.]